MKDFTTDEATFTRSIALDASTVGSVTVTVAVPATRDEEWEVLDTIYSKSTQMDFKPFLDKANDLQYDANVGFFESITHNAPIEPLATTHFGRDGSDPERVEAVQSAILVSELAEVDTLVLVDGGRSKAAAFTRAIAGITSTVPSTTHCVRAEQYFPTALLADIYASHLAHTITCSQDCSMVTPVAPESKNEYDDQWGKAYSALYENQTAYKRTPVSTRCGRTVSERIRCWFDGHVAAGASEPPMTDSLVPIVRFAKKNGFQRLADQFSEI